MKLQSRTNIYNILYTVIILTFTGVFLQFTLFRVYYKQIDDGIKTEREIIEDEIENLDTVPDYSIIFGHQIEVSLLQTPVTKNDVYKNLMLYNQRTKTSDLYRHHIFSKNRKNGLGYTISILKPMNELHKFKKIVMISISLASIFLMLAFLSTGYFVNKRLWYPFYKTLNDLNRFNLDAPATLSFSETKINEFKQLNQIISDFSLKLKRDFVRMKEFTENLSHEINTMLSIIISKVELLLQKEGLTADQVEHFRTIYQVTNSLTHLNNGLLLLAKIDNQYYTSVEKVELAIIVNEHLLIFEDFINQKNLKINTHLTLFNINMNKSLAGILISNIIINSIKHNIKNGYIEITLTNRSICIENSGLKEEEKKQENIEQYNDDKPFKSLGLGMEIIKRICRVYNFSLIYSNKNAIHTIEIGFE